MHNTGCLGLVHWEDPEGWYGEGGGRRVQDGEHMYTCGGPRLPAAALAQPREGRRETTDRTPIKKTNLSAPSSLSTSLALTPARRRLLFLGKRLCPFIGPCGRLSGLVLD